MVGFLILCALAGAFAFRGRGGVFNEILSPVLGHLSSLAGRLLYGAVMAALAYRPAVMAWSLPVLLGFAFYLGSVFPWFTDTDRDGTTLNGFVAQTMRGLVFVLPPAVVMAWQGINPWALCIGGLSLGGAYWLAARIPSKIHDLEQGPALGEAIYGAVLGIALASV